MQKVKTFFHIFINSLLPQANYYHKLIKTPFSFSRKYFLTLIFTANFLFVIFFLIRLQQSNYLSLKNTLPDSLEAYPKDLVITVENGMLRTNSERPYLYWLDVGKTKRLIAVVDETATSDEIQAYNSILLFTSTNAVVKNNKSFKEITYGKDLKIDRKYVDNLRTDLKNLLAMGSVVSLVFFIFIAPFVFALFYAVYFFVITLLAFFIFKMFARKVRLSKSFQLSLHATTLPVVIDYCLCLFKPEVARFPIIHLIFLILSFIFIFSGIFEAYLDPITRSHNRTH